MPRATRPDRKASQNNARSNSHGRGRIRYAVVGLGYISQIAVLPAFAHARENSELVALVSSDPAKLHKLARTYRVKNAPLESGETNKPVVVRETRIVRRPDLRQEIFKQPVNTRPLVHAAAPGAA